MRSMAMSFARAVCIALPLSGCIRSKGELVSIDKASTPLPAGTYYSVSNLNNGADLPALAGPTRVVIHGDSYVAIPPDAGDKPLHFHLIKLSDAGGIYILQTDRDDDRGYRDVLIGVTGKDGFCSKDIRSYPSEAVKDDQIVSAPELLRWISGHAAEIASMANDVCFVRKTA